MLNSIALDFDLKRSIDRKFNTNYNSTTMAILRLVQIRMVAIPMRNTTLVSHQINLLRPTKKNELETIYDTKDQYQFASFYYILFAYHSQVANFLSVMGDVNKKTV